MKQLHIASLSIISACFQLICLPVFASEEYGVVEYDGEEITLYDDGTWEINEPVEIEDPFSAGLPFETGECLMTDDKIIQTCAVPKNYGDPESYFDEDIKGIDYYKNDANITVAVYNNYGHEGAMADIFEIETNELSTAQKLLGSIFKINFPIDETLIYEFSDVAFSVTNEAPTSSARNGEFTTYIDIYAYEDNIELNITRSVEIEDFEGIQREHEQDVDFMLSNTFIKDRSLKSIIDESQNNIVGAQ